MPVPGSDMFCRFIRKSEWNKREDRPRAGAFKAQEGKLSIYHCDRIRDAGSELSDLCFGSLDGAGQAHHIADDYTKFATEVSELEGIDFTVVVEWRTGDQDVESEWRPWREAHAQVEEIGKTITRIFPSKYRDLMALNCREKMAPQET